MRVILAHNFFNVTGGAEVFYHEVGRVLKENNHEVAFFSPYEEGVDSEWGEFFPKPAEYKNKNIVQGVFSIKDLIYSKETKNKFKNLVDTFKPDLVHVFSVYTRLTPSFLDVCGDRNIPLLISCNDYKHICPNYKLYQDNKLCESCKGGKFYNAILKKCSKDSLKYSVASALEAYTHNFMKIYHKNVNLFLFASNFMALKTQEFWKDKPFEWDILRNPFDSKKYIVEDVYEDYILYFGRLIEEKGVDVLINAMKYSPKVKLKIIGTGPQEKELKMLVKSLSLDNVEFLGPKWGNDLNEILKKSLCVVVPSLWHENFPYVIIQSFAYGKAVIGTDRGGIPELIQNGKYGYIYPAKDYEKLAEKITFAQNNREKIIEMGKEAKIYSDENFNDEIFYENLMRVYSKFL